MLNVIAIMGRLTADPEQRTTPQGTPVTAFTVAVERSFARQGEERQTDFIEVVAWRGAAEFVCRYFHKGDMIAVDGSLQTRAYQDKNGNKRRAYEIVASNVNFAGGKGESQGRGKAPQNGSQGAVWGYGKLGSPDAEDFTVIEDSEDLPF